MNYLHIPYTALPRAVRERIRKIQLRIKLIRAGHPLGFLPHRTKTYYNDLICLVAPEDGELQRVLEWALVKGQCKYFCAMNVDYDACQIMWRLDEIKACYKREHQAKAA